MKPFAIILSLALLVSSAAAQLAFDPAVTVPSGSQPDGVLAVDLDGDGDRDLVTTQDFPDAVLVHFNDGTGSFGPGQVTLTGFATSPNKVAALDADGDGDTDIAVTLKNINSVRLLINNGAGVLTNGSTVAVGAEPRDIVAADLDGDGDADLASSNRAGNTVSIVLNNAGILTAGATVAVGAEPRDIVAGDFDGDGDMDLAVADHDSRDVAVLSNLGGAAFAAPVFNSTGIQLRPQGLVAADLDGDGDLDLGATTSGNGLDFVSVFTNTAGTFGPMTSFPVGGLDPSGIAAADFDGDGDLDVATANKDSNDMSVLENLGAATFGAPLLLAAGASPDSLDAQDLDGNGSADLVCANSDAADLSVCMNQNGGTVNPQPATLSVLTAPTPGGTGVLQCSSPSDAGKAYHCLFAAGSVPGTILPDGRVLGLNQDGLFALSLGPFSPFLLNHIGVLAANGAANVMVLVPNIPTLSGVPFWGAFVVLDPTASLGVGTISPSLQITIQ